MSNLMDVFHCYHNAISMDLNIYDVKSDTEWRSDQYVIQDLNVIKWDSHTLIHLYIFYVNNIEIT
jgi:hypothetical protein